MLAESRKLKTKSQQFWKKEEKIKSSKLYRISQKLKAKVFFGAFTRLFTLKKKKIEWSIKKKTITILYKQKRD